MKKEDPKIDRSGTYPQPSEKDNQEGNQDEFISIAPNNFQDPAGNSTPATSNRKNEETVEKTER